MTLFPIGGYCYYQLSIGVIHTGAKSGGGLVTLFSIGGYCCYQLAIGVIRTGAKSGGGLVTLFSDRWLLLLLVSYRGHTYRCQIWGWLSDAFFR